LIQKLKKPFIPIERHETIRQKIINVLKDRTLTATEISAEISIRQKEVYDHLEHIQRSVVKNGIELIVNPASCKKCGFTFKKRERLSKPGKCPICRGEAIEEPSFSID